MPRIAVVLFALCAVSVPSQPLPDNGNETVERIFKILNYGEPVPVPVPHTCAECVESVEKVKYNWMVTMKLAPTPRPGVNTFVWTKCPPSGQQQQCKTLFNRTIGSDELMDRVKETLRVLVPAVDSTKVCQGWKLCD